MNQQSTQNEDYSEDNEDLIENTIEEVLDAALQKISDVMT
jgi:hypothetical protein